MQYIYDNAAQKPSKYDVKKMVSRDVEYPRHTSPSPFPLRDPLPNILASSSLVSSLTRLTRPLTSAEMDPLPTSAPRATRAGRYDLGHRTSEPKNRQ